MTTKTFTVDTTTYTQITTQADYAILNRDPADVRIVLSDTQPPVNTDDYFLLTKENGILSAHVAGSKVWARAASGTCDITVAE
jgi:hypothetical protein